MGKLNLLGCKNFLNLMTLFIAIGICHSQNNCSFELDDNIVYEYKIDDKGFANLHVTIPFKGCPGYYIASDSSTSILPDEECVTSESSEGVFKLVYDCSTTNINLNIDYYQTCGSTADLIEFFTYTYSVNIDKNVLLCNPEISLVQKIYDNSTSSVSRTRNFPVRSSNTLTIANECNVEVTYLWTAKGGCYNFYSNPGIIDLDDFLYRKGDFSGTWEKDNENSPEILTQNQVDFSEVAAGRYGYTFKYNGQSCETDGLSGVVFEILSESPSSIEVEDRTFCTEQEATEFIQNYQEIISNSDSGLLVPSLYNGKGRYTYYPANGSDNCIDPSKFIDIVINDGSRDILFYLDEDGDYYGVDDMDTNIASKSCPSGYVSVSGDCDDINPKINPAALEIADDGIDQNCDGEDLVTLCSIENVVYRTIQPADSDYTVEVSFTGANGEFKLIDEENGLESDSVCLGEENSGNNTGLLTLTYDCTTEIFFIKLVNVTPSEIEGCSNPTNSTECTSDIIDSFNDSEEPLLSCNPTQQELNGYFDRAGDNFRIAKREFPVRKGGTLTIANACNGFDYIFGFSATGGCYEFIENPGILDLDDFLYIDGGQSIKWQNSVGSPEINNDGIVDFSGFGDGSYTFDYEAFNKACGTTSTSVTINYSSGVEPETTIKYFCSEQEARDFIEVDITFEESGLYVPSTFNGAGLYTFFEADGTQQCISASTIYDIRILDQAIPFYADDDGDGFGNPEISVESCESIEGYVTQAGDCDDTNSNINPDAIDISDDGIDQNCDGFDSKLECSLSLDYALLIQPEIGEERYKVEVQVTGTNAEFEASDPNALEVSESTCLGEAGSGNNTATFILEYDCLDIDWNITVSVVSPSVIAGCYDPANPAQCTVNAMGTFEPDDQDRFVCNPDEEELAFFYERYGNNLRVARRDFPVRKGGTLTIADQCNAYDYIFGYSAVGGCYDFNENPGILDLDDFLYIDGGTSQGWSTDQSGAPSVGFDGTVDFSGFGDGSYVFDYEAVNDACGVTSTTVTINYSSGVAPETEILYFCSEQDALDFIEVDITFEESGLYVPSTFNGEGLYIFFDADGSQNCISASAIYDIRILDQAIPFYADDDGDGFGNPEISVQSCESIEGYVTQAGDCDDTNPNIYPGAPEIPNDGIDQDCDGTDLYACTIGNLSALVIQPGLGDETYTVRVDYTGSNAEFFADDENALSVTPQSICLGEESSGNTSGTFYLTYNCEISNWNITVSALSPPNDTACNDPSNAEECEDNVRGTFVPDDQDRYVCDPNEEELADLYSTYGGNLRVATRDFPVRKGGKLTIADLCNAYDYIFGYSAVGGCYEFSENPGVLDLDDFLFIDGGEVVSWSNRAGSPTIGIDGIVDFSGFGDGSYVFDYEAFNDACGVTSTTVTINYSSGITPETEILYFCSEQDTRDFIEVDITFEESGLFVPASFKGTGLYTFFDADGTASCISASAIYDIRILEQEIPFYADDDGDGFGNPNISTLSCTNIEGYVTKAGDCDDTNPSINPDAIEVCDGIDNTCDGNIDESLTTIYYLDIDGDGFGVDNEQTNITSCLDPSKGYATEAGDCNDDDPSIYPDATEIPDDGIDQDCDGEDEVTPSEFTGCGHGYWKNTDTWCDEYNQSMNFFEVFGITDPLSGLEQYSVYTLQDALEARGGGHAKLMRDATAALLNICSDDINYPYDLAMLKFDVQWAFTVLSKKSINSIVRKYASANDLGCPPDGDNDDIVNNRSIFPKKNFKAFPNPIKKKGLTLRFKDIERTGSYKATIYNLYGVAIAKKDLYLKSGSTSHEWSINSSVWNSGVYMLEVVGQGNRFQTKLIKE